LDFFGARYYSSAQGRFTSADTPLVYSRPDNPQTWNLYSYGGNNPLNTVDPDGHCDLECLKQFGSGVADTTYRPLVQLATTNPLTTAGNIASAVYNYDKTIPAVANAVVETGKAAASGDPNAIGKVVGTVLSTVATAGAGKAATSLAQGARVAEGAAIGGATEGVSLTAEQARNLARFSKALPKAATGTSIDSLGDGVLFTAEVPGRVPGSMAVYQKAVDASGTTTNYIKTTFDPKGIVVHIKDKIVP
jgi:hypothetical protein